MNECMKLLDNGWTIQLSREDGRYVAAALPPSLIKALASLDPFDEIEDIPAPQDNWIAEGDTPTEALYRVVERVLTERQSP